MDTRRTAKFRGLDAAVVMPADVAQARAACLASAEKPTVAVIRPGEAEILQTLLPGEFIAIVTALPDCDAEEPPGTACAPYVDPALTPTLVQVARRLVGARPSLICLSDRESEVLALLAEGQPNRAIAAKLYLSEHTVRNHLQRIYRKLGVNSRQDAARCFEEAGGRMLAATRDGAPGGGAQGERQAVPDGGGGGQRGDSATSGSSNDYA